MGLLSPPSSRLATREPPKPGIFPVWAGECFILSATATVLR